MRNVLACMCALALVACATPEPIVTTQKVEVPVPVPCNALLPVPPRFSFDLATLSDRFFVKGRDLVAEILQRIAYEEQLVAALTACKNPVVAPVK